MFLSSLHRPSAKLLRMRLKNKMSDYEGSAFSPLRTWNAFFNLSLSHLAEPDEVSRPDAHLSEESSLFSSSFEDKLFPKTCLPPSFSADLITFFFWRNWSKISSISPSIRFIWLSLFLVLLAFKLGSEFGRKDEEMCGRGATGLIWIQRTTPCIRGTQIYRKAPRAPTSPFYSSSSAFYAKLSLLLWKASWVFCAKTNLPQQRVEELSLCLQNHNKTPQRYAQTCDPQLSWSLHLKPQDNIYSCKKHLMKLLLKKPLKGFSCRHGSRSICLWTEGKPGFVQ